MHKVFGFKENVKYVDRYGAYIIPIKNGKIGVVETSKGFFLIGGGSEHSETDEQCIIRECMEEIGRIAVVKQKICSAESFRIHPDIGYFHPIQSYYAGELSGKTGTSCEEDHNFVWVQYEALKGRMYVDMHSWAVEQAWNMLGNDIKC